MYKTQYRILNNKIRIYKFKFIFGGLDLQIMVFGY